RPRAAVRTALLPDRMGSAAGGRRRPSAPRDWREEFDPVLRSDNMTIFDDTVTDTSPDSAAERAFGCRHMFLQALSQLCDGATLAQLHFDRLAEAVRQLAVEKDVHRNALTSCRPRALPARGKR